MSKATTDISESKQKRHVRFHQPGVLYHVVSKTIRGEFLLTPKKGVADLCAGVVAQAQSHWPTVKLYGFACLSNHIHLQLAAGTYYDISYFVGFIKREISRRLGKKYDLPGTFWHGPFTSTALPTPESQEECLAYILSQGVKENLVGHPCNWPGLHCAKALLKGQAVEGRWFNATKYKIAERNQERSKKQVKVHKRDYYDELTIVMSPIPAWEHLTQHQRQQRANKLVEIIVKEASSKRHETGNKVLGKKKVIQMPLFTRVLPPKPPWWKERRRQLTAWARLGDRLTKEYVALYWAFQEAFRNASDCLKQNEKTHFPEGSWIPAHPCPT